MCIPCPQPPSQTEHIQNAILLYTTTWQLFSYGYSVVQGNMRYRFWPTLDEGGLDPGSPVYWESALISQLLGVKIGKALLPYQNIRACPDMHVQRAAYLLSQSTEDCACSAAGQIYLPPWYFYREQDHNLCLSDRSGSYVAKILPWA